MILKASELLGKFIEAEKKSSMVLICPTCRLLGRPMKKSPGKVYIKILSFPKA